MPKGNKEAYKNFPIYDNSETTLEENAVLCQYTLDIFNTKEPELDKPEQVETAINNYFHNCISKGLRPGNLGLYTSIGLNRKQVNDLINGRVKTAEGKTVNPGTIELLKKAIKAMSTYREMLGSSGKLNPATLIFWQKNFDGLEDVQRVELDANAAPRADLTTEEVQQKLLEDMPIESPYKEAPKDD